MRQRGSIMSQKCVTKVRIEQRVKERERKWEKKRARIRVR